MKKIIFLTIASIVFSFCLAGNAKAGASDNVSGWAWSENIGWISFNNNSGGGVTNYGVNIDQNGKLSGFAWSENIGWISFNEAGAGGTGAPPSNDPCSDTSCIAKATPSGNFGKANVNLYGWARALSNGGGWDGWIRFDHGQSNPVYIDSGGNFHGWAWGSDVVGWISFSGSGYKVILNLSGFNQPPYIDPGPPNSQVIDYQSYCSPSFPGQGQVGFRWVYRDTDGDNQFQFDFKVNNVNDVNDPNPEVNRTFNGLSNPDGTTNNQTVSVVSPIQSDKIAYNTRYYWWVRVWDSTGRDSGWIAGPSFITSFHAYPYPDFSHQPVSPAAGEVVFFTDNSVCYRLNPAGAPCKNDPIANYQWDFQDNGVIDSTVRGNVTTTYATAGNYTVRLYVTDDAGGCNRIGDSPVGAQLPLPEYHEVPPVIWLKKLFAAFISFFSF